MKRMLSIFLSVSLLLSIAACTQSNPTDPTGNTSATADDGDGDSTSAGGEATDDNETRTLRLAGPGHFTSVGLTGVTDLVSGVQRPGYEVVIERWKEINPNVELDIEASPWDNWRAVLQTAALAGDVDILLHGASITAIAEPVQSYFDQHPELPEQLSMEAMRRVDEGDFSQYIPYGATITVAPLAVVIDKEIFENYGVELPDNDWTFSDMLDLAEQLTGTDPVTGLQTYGMSMIEAASANKNYIWASRGFNAQVFEFGQTHKDTTANFTSPETANVLNYINELYQFSHPDYLEGLDTSKAVTAESDLAMFITESMNDVYNRALAGDITEKFMMVQLPAIESGPHEGQTSSHMGDWNMAISNTSEQKDLAWDFIYFMLTDEVVQEWLVDTNALPNNIGALDYLSEIMEADYFNAVQSIVTQQPKPFSASTNEWYDSGNFGTFANDLTSVLNEMFVGNMDAEAAQAYVQDNLDEFMNSLQ